MEWLNDQPGRFIALFIIAPVLLLKGLYYKDTFIIGFAIILFLWDFYWIITSRPNKYI